MLKERRIPGELASWCADRIRARAPVSREYFAREAPCIAEASAALARRFSAGGRLLAFGRGPYATDAQHVSVEFIHPVIVGKRALPALDLSLAFEDWVPVLVGKHDAVIGFGPPGGDPLVQRALHDARRRGALTLALPGEADFSFAPASSDAHLHQEIAEVVGHTLYESVHVFLEHENLGHDVGTASHFLYPYLGGETGDVEALTRDVARSIEAKAQDGNALRERVAAEESGAIAAAAAALREALDRGGTLLLLGNGGSATDATDFALDCVTPEAGTSPERAITLALEPAVLTAIGNDVGQELIFVRQLIAQAHPEDVVVAFSTSGGSKNVVAALAQARSRGLVTLAVLGYDGGEIMRQNLADYVIVVRSDYIPRIQETQAAIYHTLREGLERLRHAA